MSQTIVDQLEDAACKLDSIESIVQTVAQELSEKRRRTSDATLANMLFGAQALINHSRQACDAASRCHGLGPTAPA